MGITGITGVKKLIMDLNRGSHNFTFYGSSVGDNPGTSLRAIFLRKAKLRNPC
jgi:hypothetical protein